MADRTGIELARVGEFDLSTGKQRFTPKMLSNAAERAKAAGAGYRAPLKLGHTDPRNDAVAAADGEPAFGWLHNLRVEGEGQTSVLLADAVGMPDWLAQVAPTAYPDRSIEAYVSDEAETMEITGLALLGVTPPGMPTIATWRDLPAALGVAASAPKLIAASFTAANDAATQTPAEPPVTTPTHKEADAMSETLIKGLREQLGIKDDAVLDEAALLTATTDALAEKAEPSAPTPEAIAAAFKLTPAEVTKRLAASASTDVPAGAVVISKDILDELKIAASAGAEARKVQLVAERDSIIGGHVRAAHITPARKEFWTQKWDLDPEGTKAELATLGEPVLPIAASGYADTDETIDPAAGDDYWFAGVPTSTVTGA